MNFRRAAAAVWAVLALALHSGCALLNGLGPSAAPVAAPAASAAEPSAQPTSLGVRIDIEAPAELKALLERHLDVVRLGKLARDEVDDGEWSRLIDAAPVQVRELLQTEGYFSPLVSLERAPGRSAGQPDVVLLQVTPGPRTRVSRVTMLAEGELDRNATAGDAQAQAALSRWQDSWELPAGADFRNTKWSDAKAAALARLRAAGYANAVWSGTGAEVDAAKGEVRIFVVADSGPLFRYGGLVIEGLQVQNAQTVRDLANAKAGTPVTETLLLDFQERLQKAGLFDSVNVTLDTDPTHAAEAKLLVRVRESALQVYTLGLGVSANTGPRASVEHVYRRVFGFAATSRNKIEWGQNRQFWEGDISTHPGAGLTRNSVGGAVEKTKSDTDTVLSQRLRVGRTEDTQRIERFFFVQAERSTRDTATLSTQTMALSLNFHGGWRDLDSVVLPTRGTSLAVQLGLGHSNGSASASGVFSRAYGRLTGYLPLGRSFYGQARVEAGQVFLRSGLQVPDSQLFRAGGDDSVRGFSYRSLGPLIDGVVGGGTVMLTTSAELARPISTRMPSLWGAVFVDAGNASNNFGSMKLYLGTGAGLRWRSPVGPLRLDLAWSPDTRKTRLHFSVGIAF
jgi:translocation and assembly module TamA